jgi:hypothetical protein
MSYTDKGVRYCACRECGVVWEVVQLRKHGKRFKVIVEVRAGVVKMVKGGGGG